MKRVLVLYAARSPGMELMSEFKKNGYKTIGVDLEVRKSERFPIIYEKNFDTSTIRTLIHKNEIDIVVHPFCRFFEGKESTKEEYYQINYKIPLDIVKTLPFHSKLIYISDFSIYQPSKTKIQEKDILNPIDYYGLTKALGECVTATAERFLIIHPGFLTPKTSLSEEIKKFYLKQIKRFNLPEITYSSINVEHLAERIVKLDQKNFLATFNVASDEIIGNEQQKKEKDQSKGFILDCSRMKVLLGKIWNI